MTVGLVAESFSGQPRVMEPDEMTEWQWFSFDNLPKERYFLSFFVLENYLQKKFYIKNQKGII